MAPKSVAERARLRAEAAVAEREARREARAAAAAAAFSDGQSMNTFERAKLAALEKVASQKPGGTLPVFLAKVGARVGAKFVKPQAEPASLEAEGQSRSIQLFASSDGRYGRRLVCSDSLAAALLETDSLTLICTFAGLRCFSSIALTCHAWHDAVQAKAREWGVLTYLKAIGGGFGKRRSQLDTPTWCCWLPVDDDQLGIAASPSLCIVDSCALSRKGPMHARLLPSA